MILYMSIEAKLSDLKTILNPPPIFDPWLPLIIFVGATVIMIWRLESMGNNGLEGTVLGTLVMPYCSGLSNLIFAFVMGKTGGSGALVLENCLVNNVTNLTILIGLPSLFWSLNIFKGSQGRKKYRYVPSSNRINHLSLLLTLLAALFFSGILWALARDGHLDFGDGMVLVGIFIFWQVFHVFDVMKNNVRLKRTLHWYLLLDFAIIVLMGYLIYFGIDRLVGWISKEGSGLFVYSMLGWLSGILMVLPNALLAFYYAKTDRPDVVYTSQIGDGHICIPMCIGLFALFQSLEIPHFFQMGIVLILGAGFVHFIALTLFGRLPRILGGLLVGSYLFFVYKGIISP